MSNKKLDELLAKLEATEADLSQRATQASEAASANRNQRERAMAALRLPAWPVTKRPRLKPRP